MARTNARTLGLLNRWPTIMHADIWRFNQIDGEGVPVIPNNTNPVYIQYERDYIGRELHNAIRKFTEYLGYFPAPTWIVDEDIPINCDLRWHAQTLSTRYGYLQAFGRRAVTVIQSNVVISYSDEDGDNIEETATITVNGVTNVAVDDIQVFTRVADGAPSAAHEYWQIEPARISKSGDTATMVLHKALLAHPQKVWSKERASANWTNLFAGETTNPDSFLEAVDVYRVYTDPTDAVQLINRDAAGLPVATSVTGAILDARLGDFRLYAASGQSAPTTTPRTVRVSYKAGLPLVDGEMDNDLAVAITRYANLLFPQQPAMSDRTMAMWNEDRKDRALTGYDAWHPPPLGVTNAGMDAWTVIESRYIPLKGKATYGRP